MIRFAAGATLLFTLMWAGMTYPQVVRMRDAVNDVGDPLLNTWALAWVAHQLPFAPAHVFDGNIFHPERRTLAYSETLLAPGTIGAPLLWSGAGPILVYNLLLMVAFVASGVGTALLVRDLSGVAAPALVAGAIFAFLPMRFDHYAHFQLLHTEWMPLALWALHRFTTTHHRKWALLIGGMVGAQALTSMYNALFLATLLLVVGGVLLAADWRQLRARVPGLTLAVVLAATMAAPVAIAHLRARTVVGERSRADVLDGSARWSDFVSVPPSNVVHGTWAGARAQPEHRLFPGFLAVALAMAALWPPWSAARFAYALALVMAIDVARGLHGWIYPLFYEHLFVFRGLRMPARMAMLAGLALAVLAGFGLARLLAPARDAAQRAVVAAALGLVMIEAWSGPMRLATLPLAPPKSYADLLAHKGDPPREGIMRTGSDPPPAVIVELPINQADPTFMYYSTFHWQTLVNGYSGYASARYVMLDAQLRRFPEPDTLEELARLQTRYVLVHGELLPPDRYRALTSALDALPSFRPVSRRPWQGGEIALYAFRYQR